jgi:hypothetical protein
MLLYTEFLSMTSSLERNQAVERIMKYKLNPFEVLRCSPEMTPDEINQASAFTLGANQLLRY